MPNLRSFLSSAILIGAASVAGAQGRIIDEGTFVITRPGAAVQTESFRIRADGATLVATGQVNAGTRRMSSALTTDTLGTPLKYQLDVRDNGALSMSVQGAAMGNRLTTRSQVPRGDESTREYPVTVGNSLILEDDLLHQTYFLPLSKRSGAIQIIQPHRARGMTMTLKALGLEPVTIAGKTVTATHYSLSSPSGAREFWVDASGRLLQIEVPSTGLKAVREELPR